mmetsp:Transcript_124273/g.397848  ORF Transcript_124273/g.397848 Transcript_124273/m.397848 type:complete len:930 (-) Transcript_124273:181-2970(-)
MSHKAFHQREIEHLQEQNTRIVGQIEIAEVERDRAHEQLQACEEKDASLQNQVQGQRDRIGNLNGRLAQDKSECGAKDEHVKVLGEQNNQMLSLLEQEENKSKDYSSRIASLEVRNRKLQAIAEMFDATKAELESQVAEAKGQCAEIFATVKHVRSVNENLRANIQNTEARTRVEIEALGQAMQVVDAKNLEYLNRVNKQETREKQLQSESNLLKEEVEKVRAEIDNLRKLLEGDEDGRNTFERARSQVELQIEGLEVQADTLKKALSSAERANEQLQDENKGSADRCRETADKVYALMDSLRLNQVELKKVEAENGARDKKILSLERQTQNLQAKISMECDAKVLAEQERKEAEQEAVVLKKKNKVIESGVSTAQVAQEKAEKEIVVMNEAVAHQQTQNAYLASRIDGQEEEKNTLKAEISKSSTKSGALVADNTQLRDEIDRLEEEVATCQHDLVSYRQELEYIKREDVLDDAGRQRPVLIQSNDSDLLEKLQVNEFLYEAQQARNPVPPMIEKIAQILAMLHEGQGRADQYLADLSKSNGLVTALRQRNMALYSRTQMFESFKTRALLRYVMNLIEGELATDLYLDGLSFGPREINEMLQLIPRYDASDKIFVISLIDNGLDDDSINMLLQLVYSLPYLRRLDLKRNCFTTEGIRKFEEQVKMMEGITSIIKTADGVLNVHSGNQLRLAVDISEQIAKESVAKEPEWEVNESLTHKDADPFLNANSGATGHPWTKTEQAQVQRPPHQAVPDPSTVTLQKPTVAPEPPAIGGPPVGLGGPGNVAALNKRATAAAKKLPEKRQAKRAKEGPPPLLDYEPTQRVVDKWQSGGTLPRPSSSSRRSTASLRSGSSDWDPTPSCSPEPHSRESSHSRAPARSLSADRSLSGSRSMPNIAPCGVAPTLRKMPPPPLLSLAQRAVKGGQRPPRM